MTKQQIQKALSLAQSKVDLTNEDISLFDGYGLRDFGKVACTIAQVARLIRWQCIQFNGGIDADEWNNLVWAARHRFDVFDDAIAAVFDETDEAEAMCFQP